MGSRLNKKIRIANETPIGEIIRCAGCNHEIIKLKEGQCFCIGKNCNRVISDFEKKREKKVNKLHLKRLREVEKELEREQGFNKDFLYCRITKQDLEMHCLGDMNV